MSLQSNDILKPMNINEIKELQDFYYIYKDTFPQIYSFLKTAIRWISEYTDKSGITIFSVEGDWKSDGTFIALLQFSCYDIILHSLEDSCDKLRKGLSLTKKINWEEKVLFYATYEKFVPTIHDVLKQLEVPIDGQSTTYLWQINKSDALKLSDMYENNDFHMKKIKPEDAEVINEVWPPNYEGSVKYLETFIRRNGGYGIYEKANGKLVSWILHNILGQLGVLQTRDGYFKRGFGSILTKKLAKEVSQNGYHVIGTVHDGNLASETLFSKLGFEKKFKCIYIHTEKKNS